MRFLEAVTIGLCGLVLVSGAPTAPPKTEDEVGAPEKGPAITVSADSAVVHPVAVLMDNGDVVPIPTVAPEMVDGAGFAPMGYPYMDDPMAMAYDQYGEAMPYPVTEYAEDYSGAYEASGEADPSAPTRNMRGRRYYAGGYVPAYQYGAYGLVGGRDGLINRPIINKPILNRPLVNKPIINRPIINKPSLPTFPFIPALPIQPELPTFPTLPTLPTLPQFPTTLPTATYTEPSYTVEPAYTYPRFDADVTAACLPGEDCGTVTGMYAPARTVVTNGAVVANGPLRKASLPKRYVH